MLSTVSFLLSFYDDDYYYGNHIRAILFRLSMCGQWCNVILWIGAMFFFNIERPISLVHFSSYALASAKWIKNLFITKKKKTNIKLQYYKQIEKIFYHHHHHLIHHQQQQQQQKKIFMIEETNWEYYWTKKIMILICIVLFLCFFNKKK